MELSAASWAADLTLARGAGRRPSVSRVVTGFSRLLCCVSADSPMTEARLRFDRSEAARRGSLTASGGGSSGRDPPPSDREVPALSVRRVLEQTSGVGGALLVAPAVAGVDMLLAVHTPATIGGVIITSPTQARLEATLAQNRLSASSQFSRWLEDSAFPPVIPRTVTNAIASELGCDVPRLTQLLLPFAACFSEAAVSSYAAAAVAEGHSGSLYFGANGELPGLPMNLTIHAEQTALINAWENGESALNRLAISAPPCGQCRQFLYEMEAADQLSVLLVDRPPQTLIQLLPDPFGPGNLGLSSRLMREDVEPLELKRHAENDEVVQTTLAAARRSYAPYSRALAAVSLVSTRGAVYTGRYAESAAFNPSVLPVTSALAMLRLRGGTTTDIMRAVLVESTTQISHEGITRLVLDSVCAAALEVFRVRSPSSVGGRTKG